MATISFDRRIEIKPEDMDRFLDALEADYPPIPYDEAKAKYIGEEGLKELRKLLGGTVTGTTCWMIEALPIAGLSQEDFFMRQSLFCQR